VSTFWQRLLVALGVIATAMIIAKIVDWRISRHRLGPDAETRYRVLRRAILATIVFVGILSALLVIPEVRAIAGAILASSAVLGLVIGFAAQRTLGNVIAGILIAVSQPLRIGDEVEFQGTQGVVEEIGLTYTWIRTRDDDRFVVPNEQLASSPIRNSTIRHSRAIAEVTVQVPLANLDQTVESLRGEGDEVYVTDLTGENASIVVRKWVSGGQTVEQAASDLRIALAKRLARGAG
jgi:small-conductance mechanosensitive channel